MRGFLAGNASPLTDHPVPPVDALNAAGYGFYASGIMEKLAATPVRRDDRRRHRLGRHPGGRDPADPRDDRGLRGLTEIAITTNPGGVDHWKAIKAQELFAEHVIP
jgi:hypothetical protein